MINFKKDFSIKYSKWIIADFNEWQISNAFKVFFLGIFLVLIITQVTSFYNRTCQSRTFFFGFWILFFKPATETENFLLFSHLYLFCDRVYWHSWSFVVTPGKNMFRFMFFSYKWVFNEDLSVLYLNK